MTPRERTEQIERQFLSPRAAFSADTKGRETPEEKCELRTDYQRDRDRILHCKSFRRLKHKTQVFLAPGGDHYRTRMTHTLEVAQIARTIARALQLNEDLTEAIALGHDLGHTPFGHAGERALNLLFYDGFRHFEQSVRVVDVLEKGGEGLSLCWEVRDGMLCHTRGEEAATLEGRVVRVADRIAYINHDIEDAIRARVLREEEIPAHIREGLGGGKSERISTLINSVVQSSGETVRMDGQTRELFDELHEFMFDRVYTNPEAKGEEHKAEALIERLYDYLVVHPRLLSGEYARIRDWDGVERAVCDYIAGMSDHYALEIYNDLFVPRGWNSP